MSQSLTEAVRLIRESRTLTQQQLAEAAGVSLSTVRRLERDGSARFHEVTEERIEFALGLRKGALEHLRTGGSYVDAFQDSLVIRFPRSDHYPEAPLSDIAIEGSYIATVMAESLQELSSRAGEELALAASGRLVPAVSGDVYRDFLFDWLPWPVQFICSPVFLHRLHDSVAQVAAVLAKGLVPRPLRMAEAVTLRIASDRSWALNTNAYFDGPDEIDDPAIAAFDQLFDECDPSPLFDTNSPDSEWVAQSSPLHPARWWESPQHRSRRSELA